MLDSDVSVTVEVPLKVEVMKTVLVDVLPTLLLLPPAVTASPVVLFVLGMGGRTPLSLGVPPEFMDRDVMVTAGRSDACQGGNMRLYLRGQTVVETGITEVVTGQSVTPGPQSRTVTYEVLYAVDTETAGNSCTTATLVTVGGLSSAAVSLMYSRYGSLAWSSPVALTKVRAPPTATAIFLICMFACVWVAVVILVGGRVCWG